MSDLWILVPTILIVCLIQWSIDRYDSRKPPPQKEIDAAAQLRANRLEYARIEQEMMQAWEDACQCPSFEMRMEEERQRLKTTIDPHYHHKQRMAGMMPPMNPSSEFEE